MTAAEWSPADQILDTACREVVSTIRFGLRVGRVVPVPLLARSLELAADEAAGFMPEELQHLGATYTSTWVAA